MQRWRAAASIFVLATLVLAAPATSQTLDDTGLWFAAIGNGKFPSASEESPLLWWFDAHYRMRDDAGGFNQSILRPGLGVEVAENQVLWAGYAWIRTSPIAGADFDEHRFWQQWTAASSNGDFRFLDRSRFEQRWFDTTNDVALRWRQMVRAQYLLTSSPEWSFVAWDEVFVHLNDTERTDAGFDQNRVFLGFGYKTTDDAPVRTEIGYLNQFIHPRRGDDLMNHILSVNFFF